MSSETALQLLMDSALQYGNALLSILGALIILMLGYLVFIKGWNDIIKRADEVHNTNPR